MAWIGEVDAEGSGTCDFPGFLSLMGRSMNKETETEKQLIEAFKAFDKDSSGLISLAEVRHVLTNVSGEKLDDEDVDEILRDAEVDGDEYINYEKLVHAMLGVK